MHSLVRNDQYNVSYTSNEKIVNKSSMSSTTKCELVTTTANEPPNPTDVEDTLEKVKSLFVLVVERLKKKIIDP